MSTKWTKDKLEANRQSLLNQVEQLTNENSDLIKRVIVSEAEQWDLIKKFEQILAEPWWKPFKMYKIAESAIYSKKKDISTPKA